MPRLIWLIYHRRPTTLFIGNAYFAGESPDYPKAEAPRHSRSSLIGCSAMTMLNMDRMASGTLRQIKYSPKKNHSLPEGMCPNGNNPEEFVTASALRPPSGHNSL